MKDLTYVKLIEWAVNSNREELIVENVLIKLKELKYLDENEFKKFIDEDRPKTTNISALIMNSSVGTVLFSLFSTPYGWFHHYKGHLNEIKLDKKVFLLPESYFNYLDYVELKEARASSRRATYFAVFSNLIAIISLGFSIYTFLKKS